MADEAITLSPPIRQSLPFAEFRSRIGVTTVSDWVAIPQERIDGFARHTGDDAFIHTDPERAGGTRFRGTIAHGLLTLALLPLLRRTAVPDISDARMSVNYGFDRVRFVAPVPVDSKLRGHFTLVDAREERPGFAKVTHDVTIEIEGADRPALVSRWTIGHWLARPEATR